MPDNAHRLAMISRQLARQICALSVLTDGGDDDPHERSWRGTLVRDHHKAYDSAIAAKPDRVAAGCNLRQAFWVASQLNV